MYTADVPTVEHREGCQCKRECGFGLFERGLCYCPSRLLYQRVGFVLFLY